MAFQKAILPKCPECKQPGIYVIESRKTALSIRRRKECECCKTRFTTHEVSAEFFEQAKENISLINRFYQLLAKEPIEVISEDIQCTDCQYNNNTQCEYKFPEYETIDSLDCNWYAQKH